MVLFGVMTLSRIPNPKDDKFDKYGVSEMFDMLRMWKVCEDVESSGQGHPAMLNNDLSVGAILLE